MPPLLREFCWTVTILSLLSVVFCLLMHYVFHRHYPYDWPLYIPRDRFNDFTIYYSKFKLFHQASFFTTDYPFTYPAPVALVYRAFYKWGGTHHLRWFLAFIVAVLFVPAILFGRALRERGLSSRSSALFILVLFFLSWPALLMVDRANMEIVVWCALLIATWAFARGKEWTAATFFGIAASLKLFPFVYLALFLTRRKFPKVLLGAAVFFASSLLSLALVGPTIPIAYHGISTGLNYFRVSYMGVFLFGEGGVDHSILAFFKLAIHVFGRSHPKIMPDIVLKCYLPLTAVGGLLLYFFRIRKMPQINQLLLLTIASIYFTPFSGDGTLIHLYYSFALFCFLAIDASRKHISIRGLRVAFLCFAYLFSTESFFIAHGNRFEGQAKCLVLAVLLVVALRYPFGPPIKADDLEQDISHPDASTVDRRSTPAVA